MNAYRKFSKNLEWNDNSISWINDSYFNYLIEKLNSEAQCFPNEFSQIDKLLRLLTNMEKKSFMFFPYISNLIINNKEKLSIDNICSFRNYLTYYVNLCRKISDKNLSFLNAIRTLDHPSNKTITPQLNSEIIPIPEMSRGGNDLYLLDDEVINYEMNKVLAVGNLIKKSSLSAWNLTLKGTELLLFRGESLESNVFSSGSFRQLIGLSLIINPQNGSIMNLTEALVHESIHSFLYQIEVVYGNFITDEERLNDSFKSPWSNTFITIDNITQACFVWYGLYNFWQKVVSISEGENADCAERKKKNIIKGFENLDLDNYKYLINTQMYEAISYMKEAVVE